MQFSRSHAGMLAVVSIFTGMIAPVVADASRTYPFPLTDMQWGAYMIFALLVVSFYLVSIERWRIFRIVSILLFLLIGYLLFMALGGNIHDSLGNSITKMSWGWGFLAVGVGLLIYTLIGKEEKTEKLTLFVDHILGIIGSFTLLCLTALIVFVSYVPNHSRNKDTIVSGIFGSGKVENLSGVLLSPSFDSIEDLVFDRRTGNLRFIATLDGKATLFPENTEQTKKIVHITQVGKKLAVIYNDGQISLAGQVQSGTAIMPQSLNGIIVSRTASGLLAFTDRGEVSFPGEHLRVAHLYRADDIPVLAWTEANGSGGTNILKNNEVIGKSIQKVESIALSRSGYDTIALVVNSAGEREILKNGVRIEQVAAGYVDGSFETNGSHTMYVRDNDGIKTLVYDGGVLNGQYEEVREIFLQTSGNSYAFFARPLGEKRYCIFTRYRGNLCGLDGYMNPRLGADGGSLLYAALKDGLWSIYRNTDTVIRDTGYHGTNIINDFVFFDTTNPKQYLFIEKTSDGTYLYRKNGKIMPGVWSDVSLDVWFGYDNKVVTAAKDSTGWRVVEM